MVYSLDFRQCNQFVVIVGVAVIAFAFVVASVAVAVALVVVAVVAFAFVFVVVFISVSLAVSLAVVVAVVDAILAVDDDADADVETFPAMKPCDKQWSERKATWRMRCSCTHQVLPTAVNIQIITLGRARPYIFSFFSNSLT